MVNLILVKSNLVWYNGFELGYSYVALIFKDENCRITNV